MDDFNKLLHDQRLALWRAQFFDDGQDRQILLDAARATGERIPAHSYGVIGIFRSGRMRMASTRFGVSFA